MNAEANQNISSDAQDLVDFHGELGAITALAKRGEAISSVASIVGEDVAPSTLVDVLCDLNSKLRDIQTLSEKMAQQ